MLRRPPILLARRIFPPAAGQDRASERGSSTVETAILISVLITLLLTLMQGGVWWHTRNVALAAAEEAARAAASEHGTAVAGRRAATSFIEQSNAGMTNIGIDVRRSTTTVTVTITGHAMSVLPGITQQISQTATLPVERITR